MMGPSREEEESRQRKAVELRKDSQNMEKWEALVRQRRSHPTEE